MNIFVCLAALDAVTNFVVGFGIVVAVAGFVIVIFTDSLMFSLLLLVLLLLFSLFSSHIICRQWSKVY